MFLAADSKQNKEISEIAVILIVDIEKFFRKSEIKVAKFLRMMYDYKIDLSVKRGGSCSGLYMCRWKPVYEHGFVWCKQIEYR